MRNITFQLVSQQNRFHVFVVRFTVALMQSEIKQFLDVKYLQGQQFFL